jgi:hypothetical protein
MGPGKDRPAEKPVVVQNWMDGVTYRHGRIVDDEVVGAGRACSGVARRPEKKHVPDLKVVPQSRA